MTKPIKSLDEILESILSPHCVSGFGKMYKTCSCEYCKWLRVEMPKAKAEIAKRILSEGEIGKEIQNSKLYYEFYVLTMFSPKKKKDYIADLAKSIHKIIRERLGA